MKIAVFHNLTSGGAKRALYGNVNYLTKDHEVDVYVPSTANEDYLPLKDIVNDLKTYPVNNNIAGFLYSAVKYYPTKISLINLQKVQKMIADDINNGDYDVVLCEQDKFTMAPFFLEYIKKPTVYYCQQPSHFRYNISKKLYNNAGLEYKNIVLVLYLKLYTSKMIAFDKKYAGYSKYMVTNSKFTKELISKIYRMNSHISYLGVDNNLFKPQPCVKENFVLSVGQCIPEKGYEFILKSLALVKRDIRPDFVLITDQGNIHWKNYLLKLADELDVKLEILHLISDEKLVSLYNQAKMVVYAPYNEPFGLVPLESMSCGTPVVGVKDGGVMETVIDGKTGVLTERNEQLFANEVTKLLINPELAKNLGENGIKVVNNKWTLEESGKRLQEHLYSAVKLYK